MKVVMLEGVLGGFEGMWDVPKGTVVDLPQNNAENYIANGLCSAKHVKTPKDELPQAYVPSEESEAMRKKIAPRVKALNEEIRIQSGQHPAVAIVSTRPRVPQGGWLGP